MKDAAVYLAAVILCLHLTLPRVCKTFILYLFFSLTQRCHCYMNLTLPSLQPLHSPPVVHLSHTPVTTPPSPLLLTYHPRYSPPLPLTHTSPPTHPTHTLRPLLSPPVSTSNTQYITNTCPDAAFPSAEIQLKPHQRVLEVRRHWGELLKRFTQVPVKPQDARYAYEPKMVLRRNVFFSKRDEVKIRWVGRGEVGRMNWWAGNGGV